MPFLTTRLFVLHRQKRKAKPIYLTSCLVIFLRRLLRSYAFALGQGGEDPK